MSNKTTQRKLIAILLAALAFPVVVAAMMAALFFPVILVAGPHSDLLPGFAQSIVVTVVWLAIIIVPAWVSLKVYRWVLRRHQVNEI
jgi:fumarate reductase subunit D